MTEKRPVRMCDSCGGVDDHPRHVFAHAPGDGATDPAVAAKAIENVDAMGKGLDSAAARFEILRQVQDSSTVMKHMDCCREDGCPDGTCNMVTAGAENLRGPALVKHIQKEG